MIPAQRAELCRFMSDARSAGLPPAPTADQRNGNRYRANGRTSRSVGGCGAGAGEPFDECLVCAVGAGCLAAGLLAIVFSMIPLGEQERPQPEAVVTSPTAPTQDGAKTSDGID